MQKEENVLGGLGCAESEQGLYQVSIMLAYRLSFCSFSSSPSSPSSRHVPLDSVVSLEDPKARRSCKDF